MNRLEGTIKEIITHEGISLVRLDSPGNLVFTSVVIDTSETAGYLKTGNRVSMLFKETEVSIAKGAVENISLQNRIPCKIKAINKGILFCGLHLVCGDNNLYSIITSNACRQLMLKENDAVIALIKTNEVSLSPHD